MVQFLQSIVTIFLCHACNEQSVRDSQVHANNNIFLQDLASIDDSCSFLLYLDSKRLIFQFQHFVLMYQLALSILLEAGALLSPSPIPMCPHEFFILAIVLDSWFSIFLMAYISLYFGA